MKKIFIYFAVLTFCYSESAIEKNNQKNLNITNKNETIKYSTYKNATKSDNVKDWNTKDFQEHQGGNTGNIGNTQIFLNKDKIGSTANSNNPNLMTTEGIQNDDNFKDIKSLNAWTSDMQEDFISKNLTNSNTNAFLNDGTVKCYITRNIPIRYKCTYDGAALIFGEGMGQDGKKARRECENECYEQYSCVQVSKDTKEVSENNFDDISLEINKNSTSKSITKTITTANRTMLSKVKFTNFKAEENKKAYLDLFYTNNKNETLQIVSNLFLDKNNTIELSINDIVKEIKFVLYTKDETVLNIQIKDIELLFKKNEQFICPKYQDLTRKNPGDFAHLCPSGNYKNFSIGSFNYRICTDYGIVGDNNDGTFSNEDSCNSVCRQNYECVLDTTSFSQDILHDYQEGCIEGQTNCSEDTCKNLRLNGNKILNENVFRAGEYPIHTIINSVQQRNVIRPRPLLNEDIDYLKRNAEEWKDEAYLYMLTKNRYAQSNFLLNENTEISQAYQIGQTGVNYGATGTGTRTLFGEIKPKAFDVNGKNQQFYVVIDATVERTIFNENAEKEIIKDRILYTRISDSSDKFKPFAVIRDWGRNVNAGNNRIHTSNVTSQWECKTFTNNWYSHSCSNIMEYYKNEKILLGDNVTIRYPVIQNLNNIIYNLSGIVRRNASNGLNYIPVYSGQFNGTGEALSKFNVYFFYKDSKLSYQDVLDLINEKEILPIYDNLTAGLYSKTIIPDNGELNGKINIYQYGEINKKSAFIKIYPERDEVGKKGFIYVFGY
jgi:hypothetical protein